MSKNEPRSQLELELQTLLRTVGLPDPIWNYRFHHTRNWELDAAWPTWKVAIEVQGGIFGRPVQCHSCGSMVKGVTPRGKPYQVMEVGGKHVRPGGYQVDMEKHNAAVAAGWTIVYATGGMLKEDPMPVFESVKKAMDSQDGMVSIIPGAEPDTPTERAAIVGWLLASGEELSTTAIGYQCKMSARGARKMMNRLSRVLPITSRGDGKWRCVEQ